MGKAPFQDEKAFAITKGMGRWTAQNHALENLRVDPRQNPNGTFNRNTEMARITILFIIVLTEL
jgi:hypothetical protein